jgi:hypothetical protein
MNDPASLDFKIPESAKDIATQLSSIPGAFRCLIVNEKKIILFVQPGSSPQIPENLKDIVSVEESAHSQYF